MLRKLIKAAQDKLLKSKDKQAPAPPPPQAEIKAAPQKPPEIKVQNERPPYKRSPVGANNYSPLPQGSGQSLYPQPIFNSVNSSIIVL